MTQSEELYTGRTLGRYELLVPIAQGATAQVWAARMMGSRTEAIVAVKVMMPSAFSDEFDAESMFLDEARLVSRIRHPNVAAVLDLGEEDGALYIVIEWVGGEPLQVVLREAWATTGSSSHGPRVRGVPLPVALRIVQHAAAGLHAAHELCDEAGKTVGLVHRDVSPQNILVGYDGVVKVIDFGVAKASSNMQRTRVGELKGKVPYMAPEQAVGEQVDRRTDVFALGVVLYQLVTGKHPFRGDSEFATLARIRDERPAESPRVHLPDLPPALEAVMRKAIEKSRDARFANMLELSRALERATPAPRDVDRTVRTFIGALLLQRATKRERALREALHALGEDSGAEVRGVDEAIRPSSGIRRLKALLAAKSPAPPAAPQSSPAAPDAAADVGPAIVPLDPAPARAATPAASTEPSSRSTEDALTLQVGAEMRPRLSRPMIIAAVVTLLVVLALALWAITGDTPDTGDTSPTKHAF